MHIEALIVGAILVALGALIIRGRTFLAELQARTRTEQLRRSSLLDQKYVDQEVRAARTPESKRLGAWIAAGFGTFMAGLGVYTIVWALTAR